MDTSMICDSFTFSYANASYKRGYDFHVLGGSYTKDALAIASKPLLDKFP
ncbi:unnamed protein product [Penicillium salamii]|nr:unnamed protein product [Penicillium salamii]CAG8236648.1 unnamed protein product [Penicillium salamii]CAG8313986.1 unnamed protein product [Penicillium salamii]CAG8340956.1 unnamed protein product [Penicillium salamii]CAG8429372.1 unnamed protein product [Penicillium salamii]